MKVDKINGENVRKHHEKNAAADAAVAVSAAAVAATAATELASMAKDNDVLTGSTEVVNTAERTVDAAAAHLDDNAAATPLISATIAPLIFATIASGTTVVTDAANSVVDSSRDIDSTIPSTSTSIITNGQQLEGNGHCANDNQSHAKDVVLVNDAATNDGTTEKIPPKTTVLPPPPLNDVTYFRDIQFSTDDSVIVKINAEAYLPIEFGDETKKPGYRIDY